MDAAVMVAGFAAAAVAATYIYFRLVQLPPPPGGVMNLIDVAVMIVAVVAIPYLYLVVPSWAMTSLLLVAIASILHLALEPLLPRLARWVVVLVVLGADVAVYTTSGGHSTRYALTNNALIVLLVVATANLCASSQSGSWVKVGRDSCHATSSVSTLTARLPRVRDRLAPRPVARVRFGQSTLMLLS